MTHAIADLTPYVTHARRIAAERRVASAGRSERAWATARAVADYLREAYQPERVIVFGSLARPDGFGLDSDIDLAVEGIPWPAYLRACNDVEARGGEFTVDLVDVAIVSDRMRARIEAEGVPV